MKLVEINWNPTDRQLRQFAAISALVLPAIAWSRGANPTAIISLTGAGVMMAVVGWFLPQTLKPLFVGLTIAAIPIGLLVSEFAMLAIYILVFLPIGLAFRIVGRDSLQLKCDRQATTYWQPKKQPAGVATYYRQS